MKYWQRAMRTDMTELAAAVANAAIIFSPMFIRVQSIGIKIANMMISNKQMANACQYFLRQQMYPPQKERSALQRWCTCQDCIPFQINKLASSSQSTIFKAISFILSIGNAPQSNSLHSVCFQMKSHETNAQLQYQQMRKITIIFWLIFWLFIYKIAFLHQAQTNQSFALYRDQQGIPHIFAKNYKDIFFGLGYASAQDRLFGLFVKKMMISGRLAECFGPEALLSDLEMRNIGFHQMAKANIDVTNPQIVQYIQQYANGLNTYARTTKMLPFEFYLFWIDWVDWTVQDTLAIINFISFNLEFDWFYEIARQRLLQTVGFDLSVKIITYGFNNLFKTTTILNDQQIKQMGRYKEYNHTSQLQIIREHWANSNFSLGKVHFPEFEHAVSGSGSNAWVIGGNHTSNGKPLLANDPHVASLIPSLFYSFEFVLLDENNQVINRKFGATVDGIPSIGMGIGNGFAYGSTAAYIDNKDVFYETVRNSSGQMQYLFKNQWKDFKERKQVIKVRGGQDIEQTFFHTHRGVVIQTIFMDMHWKYGFPLPEKYKNNRTISLSALHYTPDSISAQGHVRMLMSNNIQEHINATRLIQYPNIDSVFINKNGTFGYMSVGSIPKRDIPEMGSFIKDGNTDIYDMKGVVDGWDEPMLFNPSKGYLGLANNKFASDHFEFRNSLQEIVTGRAYRLQEIIKSKINKKQKFNINDMQQMQLDQRDEFVATIMPKLIQKIEEFSSIWQSPTHRQILQKLKEWNYVMGKDSVQASFYHVWEYLFQHSLFQSADLSEVEIHAIINHGYFQNYQFVLLQKIAENNLTDEQRIVCLSNQTKKFNNLHPCEASVALAFKELPNELKKLFKSNNIQDYRWGVIHNQQFRVIPMGEIPVLNKLWQRFFPAGGNSRTLNVAIFTHQSKTYNTVGNPVFRMVTDLEESYYSLDVGITDRVFSPYYDNFVGKNKYIRYTPNNPFLQPLPKGWILTHKTLR